MKLTDEQKKDSYRQLPPESRARVRRMAEALQQAKVIPPVTNLYDQVDGEQDLTNPK